jgi:hypothetical protein
MGFLMEIKMALVADAANLSQEGKLNILGAFNNINTHELPARHPEMQLVLNMEASPAEAGLKKHLEVKLLGEDGLQVGGLVGDFGVPEPRKPGERVRMGSILRVTDAVFPQAGAYSFSILIDGDEKATIPLSVTIVAKGSESSDG